ncbi:MAG: AbrB family transcriptional regulator [Escherichia sp.]
MSINLLLTILLAVVAGTAGCLLRLPSGTMLIRCWRAQCSSLVSSSPSNSEWLLAMAYMAIGWRIGLGFDKQYYCGHCARYRKSCCRFCSLAICAGMAWG